MVCLTFPFLYFSYTSFPASPEVQEAYFHIRAYALANPPAWKVLSCEYDLPPPFHQMAANATSPKEAFPTTLSEITDTHQTLAK